jgi:hypothetical protein
VSPSPGTTPPVHVPVSDQFPVLALVIAAALACDKQKKDKKTTLKRIIAVCFKDKKQLNCLAIINSLLLKQTRDNELGRVLSALSAMELIVLPIIFILKFIYDDYIILSSLKNNAIFKNRY